MYTGVGRNSEPMPVNDPTQMQKVIYMAQLGRAKLVK